LPDIVNEEGIESTYDFIKDSPAGKRLEIFSIIVSKEMIENNVQAQAKSIGKQIRVYALQTIDDEILGETKEENK